MLNTLIQYFTPRGKLIFFPLFDKAAENVVTMAKLLQSALNDPASINTKDLYHKIDRLENIGDDITHEINIEISKNFITPFDREDILSLTSAIDDVADYIHESVNRMFLYDLRDFIPPIQALSELILQGSIEMQALIHELKDISNVQKIEDYCKTIYEVETKADQVYNKAIADLFEHERDAIKMIKFQEILLGMETATDMFKDFVKSVESIMVKYG